MKKSISSRDVAREAEVSRATVSYILNKTEGVRIKPETRERVLEVAKRLGYHPDSTARALKTGKSMTIGVVTRRNVSEDRFTWVLKGIKEVLSMNKYSILLCSDSLNDKGYPEYYSHYHEHRIDGVLFVSHIESMDMKQVEQTAETIQKEQIPAVFIDYHIDNPMVNCVDFNYSHGGYLAARHLIEHVFMNQAPGFSASTWAPFPIRDCGVFVMVFTEDMVPDFYPISHPDPALVNVPGYAGGNENRSCRDWRY